MSALKRRSLRCVRGSTLSVVSQVKNTFQQKSFLPCRVSRKTWASCVDERWNVLVEGLGHHVDVVMVGGDGA